MTTATQLCFRNYGWTFVTLKTSSETESLVKQSPIISCNAEMDIQFFIDRQKVANHVHNKPNDNEILNVITQELEACNAENMNNMNKNDMNNNNSNNNSNDNNDGNTFIWSMSYYLDNDKKLYYIHQYIKYRMMVIFMTYVQTYSKIFSLNSPLHRRCAVAQASGKNGKNNDKLRGGNDENGQSAGGGSHFKRNLHYLFEQFESWSGLHLFLGSKLNTTQDSK